MTIYSTPFDPETKQATAPSVDSGFSDLGEALACMGEPISASQRTVIYPGLAFTDYPVCVDNCIGHA